MITRSAIFEGHVISGDEDAFFTQIAERLVPVWRRTPNAVALRVYRPVRRDDDAPPIALIQEVDYPSLEALDEALNSPVRAEARAITMDLMRSFKGRFYHVVSQRTEND